MKFCETLNRSGRKIAQYRNKREVVDKFPEAEKIIAVVGGYAVFETLADYDTWRKQK